MCIGVRKLTQSFTPLFEFLGIPINSKKVVKPSKSLTCMGIDVNLETKQLTVPQDKLLKILDLSHPYGCKSDIKTAASKSFG